MGTVCRRKNSCEMRDDDGQLQKRVNGIRNAPVHLCFLHCDDDERDDDSGSIRGVR